MAIDDILRRAQDAATVRRVYSEPFIQDGKTIITAAVIRGGGGGGGGSGTDDSGSEGQGEGLGYGLSARPVGAFVAEGNEWKWISAFDLNRFFVGGYAVAIAYFLTVVLVKRVKAKAEVKVARARH